MIKETEKYNNSNIFEGMPSISAVIKSIELGYSDRKITAVWFDKAKKHSKSKELAFLSAKSHSLNFSINFTDCQTIDSMTIGSTHGGIIAECTERTFNAVTKASIIQNGVYYVLDGIEDPYNYGNAVRSLYASGADGIVLSERNWLSVAGTVARASAGASELLPTFVGNISEAIRIFKACGYRVICAGIRDSISLFEAELSKPLLVVLGGEKRGISRSVLELADEIVRIDYGSDFHGSLTASASAAVFGFEIFRYNKK